MSSSQHLRDLKSVWGEACHTMWTEVAALRCTESFLLANYASLPDDRPLTDLVYAPEAEGRVRDLTKKRFLERIDRYLQAVVSSRLVLLSAAFELYFRYFLDEYIATKPRYYDPSTQGRTPAGDKFFGEVTKVRGLSERIAKFAELSDAKINQVTPRLPALTDVYLLRNVIAHRAGMVDVGAASRLSVVSLAAGQRVVVTVDQLLALADSVLSIANALDVKIAPAKPAPPRRRPSKANPPRPMTSPLRPKRQQPPKAK